MAAPKTSRRVQDVSHEEWAAFCALHDLEMVVLFGSQATGRTRPTSDVDLALRTSRKAPDVDYQEGVWESLLHLLGRADVDLVWLNHPAPLLGYQVAVNGILLHEARPGAFRDFRLYALKRHWDAKRFYDLKRRSLQRFIEEARHGR